MTRINNTPPYAEEQIQLTNEEQLTLQRMLGQFEQPIPDGFIKIETEHICSTKPTWECKPLSERYSFTHEGKWRWIDISHELMEKMGLQKGEDIKQNLYLDPDVLTHPKTYKGITIQEGEIFLKKPFTIQNLEKDISKLFEIIKKLEREKGEKQEIITGLEKEIEEAEKLKNIWRNKYFEKKQNNDNLTAERDDYQSKYDGVEEELKQKQEVIRNCLKRIGELEKKNEEQKKH